jgi:hypothetical protein
VSESPFLDWAKATVIGDGLSVIKFFIDPFEKLAPANWKAVSESPFLAWANATVIGDGLSVIKFFIDPFEKLAPAN